MVRQLLSGDLSFFLWSEDERRLGGGPREEPAAPRILIEDTRTLRHHSTDIAFVTGFRVGHSCVLSSRNCRPNPINSLVNENSELLLDNR